MWVLSKARTHSKVTRREARIRAGFNQAARASKVIGLQLQQISATFYTRFNFVYIAITLKDGCEC